MEENDKKVITAAMGSPFSREIHEAKLPEGFNLLTTKAYGGKSDPQGSFGPFQQPHGAASGLRNGQMHGVRRYLDKSHQKVVKGNYAKINR